MVLVLFETMSNKMSKSRYFLAVVVVAVVVAVVFLAVVVPALALANSPQPHPPAMPADTTPTRGAGPLFTSIY